MNNKDVIKQDNEAFLAEILEKREIRRDHIRAIRHRVKTFRASTYVFQVLSFLTATYFIYHYARDYAGFYVALVWSVGLIILAVLEVGKRYAILETAQGVYNPEDRHRVKWVPLIIATIALSATISYQGGSKFVKEENSGPDVVHNAEIDSIRQLIAAQETTKAELATSKWKGSLTRGARDGITAANAMIADLNKELRRLQKVDDYKNEVYAKKHEDKFNTFGYIFGGFAGFLDGLLLFLLFWAERDETTAERWVLAQSKKKSMPAPAPHLKAVNNAHDARKEELLLSRLEELETKLSRAHAHTPAPAPAPAHTHAPAPTRERTRAHAREGKKRQHAGEKVCRQCGKKHNGPRAKFCSDECSKVYQATRD